MQPPRKADPTRDPGTRRPTPRRHAATASRRSRGRGPASPSRSRVVAIVGHRAAALVAAGTPAASPTLEPGIDAAAADLLQLDVLPPPALAAPDFSLTDQHGRPASVSALRGKAVVLSFNDDECQDLCTLLAQDVVAADHDLGAAAKDVVFLSVNANPLHPAVADVAAWTDSHGLGGADNWVFATGTADRLAQVADSYHVPVSVDRRHRRGRPTGPSCSSSTRPARRWRSASSAPASASTALFAHDMAQMAADLLPSGSRLPVAGPTGARHRRDRDPGRSGARLTLPVLGDPSSTRVARRDARRLHGRELLGQHLQRVRPGDAGHGEGPPGARRRRSRSSGSTSPTRPGPPRPSPARAG